MSAPNRLIVIYLGAFLWGCLFTAIPMWIGVVPCAIAGYFMDNMASWIKEGE